MGFIYTSALLAGGRSYRAYRDEIATALAHPPLTEAEQKMRPHIERNAGVMASLDGTVHIGADLQQALEHAPSTIWLVLTEGWCGDAAFSVPVLAAIEQAFPGKVTLRLLLRDENPDLMDAHLTDGGRAIPRLIVLGEGLKELATWGPRPAALQQLMKGWKQEDLPRKELIVRNAEWYRSNNTQLLQQELADMVRTYSKAQ